MIREFEVKVVKGFVWNRLERRGARWLVHQTYQVDDPAEMTMRLILRAAARQAIGTVSTVCVTRCDDCDQQMNTQG
jgi:hypothetical protein